MIDMHDDNRWSMILAASSVNRKLEPVVLAKLAGMETICDSQLSAIVNNPKGRISFTKPCQRDVLMYNNERLHKLPECCLDSVCLGLVYAAAVQRSVRERYTLSIK